MQHTTNSMNPQQISIEVLLEKYAKGDESSVGEIRARVAKALASNEKNPVEREQEFLTALENGFIPAGRINSAAGVNLQATLINCFVQPVGDSISEDVDGKPSIYGALARAAETMRRGGGVGYNFSQIRPKQSKVKGTSSAASGPLSYMRVFDKSCETVESAGARRGAQMGVLNVNHPDIFEFTTAKQVEGELKNFNVSVAVSDEFMEAVRDDKLFELVHKAEPADSLKQEQGCYLREDGMWVYRTIKARELWETIMRSTYDFAEPGILFIDQINRENNLHYIEVIEATNPCGEQPLPPYGCCDLGSVNLVSFVRNPFGLGAKTPWFDRKSLEVVVKTAVRMLDNVLDLTRWPLEEQATEAQNKRRIGIGFTGLGDALVMLGIHYDSDEARDFAAKVSEAMRDAAYEASIELAKERGAFPLLDAEKYLESGFAKRLPEHIRQGIREHGIRNSHLTSIAPTGTISLAFADNASNGIEPAFSWTYNRKKRMADGSTQTYAVEDHAYRVYRSMGGDVTKLPSSFVSALELSARAHKDMVAAVAPYVDAAISKTVNVPADYPYEDFQDLYMSAWESKLKGLATYRPSAVRGSVLSVTPTEQPVASKPETITLSEQDRRLVLKSTVTPPTDSLLWPSRPELPAGATGWISTDIRSPEGSFVIFVSEHLGSPFEVWVNGPNPPSALGAIAKTLSMDMRARDKGWMAMKLNTLAKTSGSGFDMVAPGTDTVTRVPSAAAALAQLVRYRYDQLGALNTVDADATPVLDALFAPHEPKTGVDGTLAWVADVNNPTTGDDFHVMVKELSMPDGKLRPYSVSVGGAYPKAMDGLCQLLSLDMRVVDVTWIGMKLRKLLNYAEPRGDFLARNPATGKMMNYPSTVAYVAQLVIHRYVMLGLLKEDGFPVVAMGVVATEPSAGKPVQAGSVVETLGKQCPECHNHTVIRKDGCDFCTSCGRVGTCG